MLLQVLSPCLVLACLVSIVRTELFTSIADLERVMYSEQEVVHKLRQYADREDEKIKEIRRIADDYEAHSRHAMSQGVHFHMTNPLNAYLLVRKLTSEWKNNVVTLIQSNTGEDFLNSIQQSLTSFPTQEDLTGATMALLRLQDTYSLSTESIAQGDLLGVRDSPPLSAGECFDIAKQAYFQNDFYHAIPWLRQALDVLETETYKTTEKVQVLDFLAFATYMQGNVRAALNLTDEWIKLKPDDNDRAYMNKRNYEDLLHKSGETVDPSQPLEIKNEQVLDSWHGSQEFKDYESLCRGEDVLNQTSNKDLKCYLRRHSPVFMLRPLKEEQLSIDPGVWIMHDLVSDQEIAKIKEKAIPLLHRSGVFLAEGTDTPLQDYRTSKRSETFGQKEGDPPPRFRTSKTSSVFSESEDEEDDTRDYRVSKTAWLNDDADPIIDRLSQKISAMCNLSLDNVEDLQVLNYGIGGHYEPHFDFARDWETNTFQSGIGNRIATNICYLTDVLRGGLTVFTTLGLKIWPEKGSCALWYNLRKSGDGDFETKHAGCPVLAGDKWVANKWFHERGQEFVRPCDKNPGV